MLIICCCPLSLQISLQKHSSIENLFYKVLQSSTIRKFLQVPTFLQTTRTAFYCLVGREEGGILSKKIIPYMVLLESRPKLISFEVMACACLFVFQCLKNLFFWNCMPENFSFHSQSLKSFECNSPNLWFTIKAALSKPKLLFPVVMEIVKLSGSTFFDETFESSTSTLFELNWKFYFNVLTF